MKSLGKKCKWIRVAVASSMQLVSEKCRLQTGRKMQTEGKMQTEDCIPGLKCRLGSKRISCLFALNLGSRGVAWKVTSPTQVN